MRPGARARLDNVGRRCSRLRQARRRRHESSSQRSMACRRPRRRPSPSLPASSMRRRAAARATCRRRSACRVPRRGGCRRCGSPELPAYAKGLRALRRGRRVTRYVLAGVHQMRRRLYFIMPDLASARKTMDDLLLARIEERHIHFLAKRGTPMEGLNEANHLQKSDLVHGAQVGLALGALLGFVLGGVLVMSVVTDEHWQIVTVLGSGLIGALFGAWVASM